MHIEKQYSSELIKKHVKFWSMLHNQVISFSINLEFLRIEIFCSARHLVEDFLLDV